MNVVCIGDSITAAQHAPAGTGWVELLGHANKGVPGDTTRLGLERFPADVQQSGADVVVIQFGHNDANRWQTDHGLTRVSLDAYRANLAEMVNRAKRFNIKPMIVGLTCPDRADGIVRDCRQYNFAAQEIAVGMNVRWCSMWLTFGPSHYLDGGIHLTEEGHRLYADIVDAQIRNLR